MEITIGSITFGGESIYRLAPNIEGLESAAIRTNSGLYAGVDGGYVSAQLYGHRTISFSGFILGDCDTLETARQTLFTTLKIKTLWPIGIVTFDGRYRATTGYVTDIKSAFTSPTACEFQITILCPDPLLYLSSASNPTSPQWTQVSLKENGGTTVVNNAGTATVYPVISVTPAASQIHAHFVNSTLGQNINLQSFGTNSATIVIDMENRTVLRGSTSLAANRTLASSWWGLQPGNNSIVYNTANVTGSTASIRYKTGYQGI